MDDADFICMRRATKKLAKRGARRQNCRPIGCVIEANDHIVGESYNEVDQNSDPTAHAEIMTIRRTQKGPNISQLRGATLYSTLENCGIFSMASIQAGISRIICGDERHQVHNIYFEDCDLDAVDFIRDA